MQFTFLSAQPAGLQLKARERLSTHPPSIMTQAADALQTRPRCQFGCTFRLSLAAQLLRERDCSIALLLPHLNPPSARTVAAFALHSLSWDLMDSMEAPNSSRAKPAVEESAKTSLAVHDRIIARFRPLSAAEGGEECVAIAGSEVKIAAGGDACHAFKYDHVHVCCCSPEIWCHLPLMQ